MRFPENDASKSLDELVRAIYETARDKGGNFRPEDVISTAAAFVGEAIMRQAHEFDFDNHTFTPGQPIFSEKVNELLSGDRSEWEELPKGCVFDLLYSALTKHPKEPWPHASFPDIRKTYQLFATARKQGVSAVSTHETDWVG